MLSCAEKVLVLKLRIKKYACWCLQLFTGGAGYGMLEVLWRGYTHISMFIAGGLCFWLLIRIAKLNYHIISNILLGGLCVTGVEFVFGCVVNLWLRMGVWDYSAERFHFMGQVCVRYTLLWILLCTVTIPFCKLFIRKYTALRRKAN
jgi:uncharacterized membrane protein